MIPTLPDASARRRHRRRHHRLLGRLSPGATRLADVVLLEREQAHRRLDLACRRAWSGSCGPSANITQLLSYSVELYDRLEAETGQATGWKRNGGLRLACNAERRIEIKRQATTAHSFGLEMHLLSPAEAQALWPLMDVDDWSARPSCRPTARPIPPTSPRHWPRARAWRGVTSSRTLPVTGFEIEDGRVRGASPTQGEHRLRGGRRSAPANGRAQIGAHGRRHVPLQLGTASVPHHRAHRGRHRAACRRCATPTGYLFQGRGRRPRHGRL